MQGIRQRVARTERTIARTTAMLNETLGLPPDLPLGSDEAQVLDTIEGLFMNTAFTHSFTDTLSHLLAAEGASDSLEMLLHHGAHLARLKNLTLLNRTQFHFVTHDEVNHAKKTLADEAAHTGQQLKPNEPVRLVYGYGRSPRTLNPYFYTQEVSRLISEGKANAHGITGMLVNTAHACLGREKARLIEKESWLRANNDMQRHLQKSGILLAGEDLNALRTTGPERNKENKAANTLNKLVFGLRESKLPTPAPKPLRQVRVMEKMDYESTTVPTRAVSTSEHTQAQAVAQPSTAAASTTDASGQHTITVTGEQEIISGLDICNE